MSAFTRDAQRSYIPALVTECARELADANLVEHGRSLLLAMVSREKEFKGMLMHVVANQTKLFEDLLGAEWVRDYLNTNVRKRSHDYTYTLDIAQGWFNLREFEMANKAINRIVDKRPRPGSVDDWTHAVLQSPASSALRRSGGSFPTVRCRDRPSPRRKSRYLWLLQPLFAIHFSPGTAAALRAVSWAKGAWRGLM